MGWGFRKSVSLGKGVRVNIGKRGVGVSAGVKGLRVGVGPSGARVRTSLPGTGLYYEKRLRTSKGRKNNVLLQQPEAEKMNALAQNETVVNSYEQMIHLITNMHSLEVNTIDWEQIANSAPPFPEGIPGPKERKAISVLESYKPTFRDKLFNRIDARKSLLQEKIEVAKKIDQQEFNEWKSEVDLANGLLNKQTDFYSQVLDDLASYDLIEGLGSEVYVQSVSSNEVTIVINVNSPTSNIPAEVKSLTKTGKVSIRKMGVTKYNELILSTVTSATLMIAKEIFAFLPVESVYVHCNDTFENKATGFSEEGTILSVLFDREQFNEINFNNIDPSETITLFQHNMKFLKTKGLQVVEPLAAAVTLGGE